MMSIIEISPREFEELSAEFLRSKGFRDVHRTGQGGDLGVDIRCRDEHGRLVVAQCKRYHAGAKIGSPEIQKFFGMVVHAGAARGIFVTTSDFTSQATKLARERDLELVPGYKIGEFYDQKVRRLQAEEVRRRQAEHESNQQQFAPTVGEPRASDVSSVLTIDPAPETRPIPRSAPPDDELAFWLVWEFLPYAMPVVSALMIGFLASERHWGSFLLGANIIACLGYFVALDIWAYKLNLTGRSLERELFLAVVFGGVLVSAIAVGLVWHKQSFVTLLAAVIFLILLIFTCRQWDRETSEESEMMRKVDSARLIDWIPAWSNHWLAINRVLSAGSLAFLIYRAF